MHPFPAGKSGRDTAGLGIYTLRVKKKSCPNADRAWLMTLDLMLYSGGFGVPVCEIKCVEKAAINDGIRGNESYHDEACPPSQRHPSCSASGRLAIVPFTELEA